MTQERINEILAIVDRAKEYDGINYALERAVRELIHEVKLLQDELEETPSGWTKNKACRDAVLKTFGGES
jgi:hypothetical protein